MAEKRNYGTFSKEEGSYCLTSIPKAGEFEYFLKNGRLFLKLDQFGPSFMQLDPLGGIRVIKRMERETFSPWKVLFTVDGRTYNNFDIYSADSICITYSPQKCVYKLVFGSLAVSTSIMVHSTDAQAFMTVTFENSSSQPVMVHAIQQVVFDPVDSTMQVWDKKEWWAKTSCDVCDGHPSFLLHHSSLHGDKSERRDFNFVCSNGSSAQVTSYELLRHYTRNFSFVDSSIVPPAKDNYSYEQVCAAYYDVLVKSSFTLKSAIHAGTEGECQPESLARRLDDSFLSENERLLKAKADGLASVRRIKTRDKDFDSFVNSFLPMELSWVMDLDRGWASGMRGSRDCSNDFMGYLAYDAEACRKVLVKLLQSQRRSDGWFPRQIPFGAEKYDMREFVDSGCFVIEFLYEYLAYTDDYSVMEETFCYLGEPEVKESGLEHLARAAKYYAMDENVGEHGLVKLRGGDWLDALSGLGKKGRAETLMVTCQAVMAFSQTLEIMHHLGDFRLDSLLEERSLSFKKAVKSCFNSEGWYDALFTDDGRWLFSSHDIDGHSRAYIPANSYAILAEADPSKDRTVIANLKRINKLPIGYALIYPPFGNPPFEGLGKLSSGDYFPYHLANGSVYNHGSQMFFLRAIAKAGDHESFKEVLDFALPYNQDVRPESETCLPMYAITNSYTMVPSFNGRAGHAFLTGTIAMIERAVYNWMLGLDFGCEDLRIRPCLPREFSSCEAFVHYKGHRLDVLYEGFGSEVAKCAVNGVQVPVKEGCAFIGKGLLDADCKIVVSMR